MRVCFYMRWIVPNTALRALRTYKRFRGVLNVKDVNRDQIG